MLKLYKQIWLLLLPSERREAGVLMVLVVAMSLLQLIGVASVMPFLSVAANPTSVETNAYLKAAYEALRISDVDRFLQALAAAVFVTVILSSAIKALATYAIVRFSELRRYALSQRLMAGYLQRPFEFFLQEHTANLGSNILGEADQLVSQAIGPAVRLIADSAVVMSIMLLLVVIDPVLAGWIVLGAVGCYGGIYLWLGGLLGRVGSSRLAANRARYHVVQEAFASIKGIKVGGHEGFFLRRYEDIERRYVSAHSYLQIATQIPRFAFEGVAFGGLLIVLMVLLERSGSIAAALPVLGVYAFGAFRLLPAMQSAYANVAALRYSASALESMRRELAAASAGEICLPTGRPAALPLKTAVQLDRVTFSYPGMPTPALKDVSLTIPALTTVAFVGPTGSGKSTIANLLLGLLEADSGRLLVDGTPIDRKNVDRWQATIGYVPQDVRLADASIRSNIAFGISEQDVDEEAVQRAARIANLHQYIISDLEDGYDSTVGENGVRLSGGQRQQMGIARALYHDPAMLVLDEATSALDNLTENAVMNAVNGLARLKTVVLIAHRLSTVRNCDRIIVLDGGAVSAVGTYESLCAEHDRFREMVEAG